MKSEMTRRNFFAAGSAAAIMSSAMSLPGGENDKLKGKRRKWIDTHIHVSDFSRQGKKREKLLDDLLEVLDRCDADLRFIIFPDDGNGYDIRKNPEDMMRANRMVHELCRRAPDRLFGGCMVNPNFTDEALRVMKTCFEEWGFVHLGEMLTYAHGYRMIDPAAEKIVRAAARYDVPVQIHVGTYAYWPDMSLGNGSGDAMDHLADLMRIAKRVPEAKYILAHAIGCGISSDFISWANMILDTLKSVYPTFPRNFWVEIRDFHCEGLARTLREVPVDRLLSGTDWTTRIGPPFQSYGTMFDVLEKDNPFPPKVGSFVEYLRKAGASEADIARIGYENARELYKLPV